MTADNTEDTNEPRPFATFLIEHAKGRSHDELSEKLRDVVEAVIDTGKPGSLTCKVSIKPTKQEGTVEVTVEAVAKTPTVPASSIFFATDDYDLVRSDPRQTSLFDTQQETTR